MFSSAPLPRRSLGMALPALLIALTLSACIGQHPPQGTELAPFSSDGCSLFPDGPRQDRSRWCDCCQEHDLAYWQGGSSEERTLADTTLRDCVLTKTSNPQLAETIYLGARAGGHPAFPTWYRWGYGWAYGRSYQPLSAAERLKVQRELATYRQEHPAGYCMERSKIP